MRGIAHPCANDVEALVMTDMPHWPRTLNAVIFAEHPPACVCLERMVAACILHEQHLPVGEYGHSALHIDQAAIQEYPPGASQLRAEPTLLPARERRNGPLQCALAKRNHLLSN